MLMIGQFWAGKTFVEITPELSKVSFAEFHPTSHHCPGGFSCALWPLPFHIAGSILILLMATHVGGIAFRDPETYLTLVMIHKIHVTSHALDVFKIQH